MSFEEFFDNPRYLRLKNSLFNYLNRKKSIEEEVKKLELDFKNIKILDIGSGISPVSPFPNNTIFIDKSKKAVSVLKKQGKEAGVGDITKLEIQEKFDIVLCSEVLEHVKDYEKALREIKRVLKSNGRVILTVPCYKKYWGFDDEFVGHYRRFEPEEFESKLNKIFKIIREKNVGSKLERRLTLIGVRKYEKNKELNKFKVFLYSKINYFLYLAVRVASKFTRKENASIILYVCKVK